MYARVASFEGSDSANLDAEVARIKEDVDSGNLPEGLEDVKGFLMLLDRKSGKNLSILFFEDEEGLRRGDEAMNKMSPSEGSMRRTSVEIYEVPIQTMR